MVIDNLKKLINNEVHIGIETEHGFFKIKETEPNAKLKEVKIEGIDINSTFAFKLDYKDYRLSQYLNPAEKDILKACDAIIFTIYEGKGYIFICELKSFDLKKNDVISKIKSSNIFLDYINAILKTFYEESDFEFFKRKNVLFHRQKLRKTGSRPKQMIEPEFKENTSFYKAYNYRKINIGKLIQLKG